MNLADGTTDDQITIKLRNTIGYLQFVNVLKHNALQQTAWEAVPAAVSSLVAKGARGIVLSGAGQSFCAGADISEFATVRKNAETARVYEKTNIDAFAAIRNVRIPTIAHIRGYCLGGGFGLAAACDLRVADDTAVFGVPAAKLGLGYPVDAMKDIVHAVGVQNAKRLLFTGGRFTAKQMLEMGFLTDVLRPETLDNSVQALIEEIVSLAPLTHKATKAAIDAATGGDVDHAITASDATFASKDYFEGRKAFAEKRKPRFTGR